MIRNWKTLAALVALCVASVQAFAQDAAQKFNDLAPKMTAQNMADEGQVREMEQAQQDWMYFCLQDGAKSSDLREETNKIMLDAIAGDYPVPTKAWLLHLLQWTGNDACVEGIAALLSSEPALFDGAARALAQIPTDKALDALKKAQAASDEPARFDPYIKTRSVDISVGVEVEAPLALPYMSSCAFESRVKGFAENENVDEVARVLGAIRVRKATGFLKDVLSLTNSDNPEVRRAALLALEKIATGKEFPALYEQFSYDLWFVANIMKNVVGDDFSAAVVDALKKEKDGGRLAALAEVVSGRYLTSEVGTLLDLAKKPDCPARIQLLTAAERLATKDNVGDFIDASFAIEDRGDRDRAEQIVSRLCEGDATPAIQRMNNENAAQMMALIGRIGGDAALQTVDGALKSGDPNAAALGVRALCSWPNAIVWEKLLDAAQNKVYPDDLRIRALRSFIRVVSLPDDQDGIDMSDKDKLANLKKAFSLATRDEERKFSLERVGAVRDLDSVRFALQYVDDAKLAPKAINAILDLAHHDYLRKQDKELFIKALDIVLEKGDQGQKDRADGYRSNIR